MTLGWRSHCVFVKERGHRVDTDGGERITLVTSRRPLGSYAREPWAATGGPSPAANDFTVIDLILDADGEGTGTMSLAAQVVIDTSAGTVTLKRDDSTPILLDAVTRELTP